MKLRQNKKVILLAMCLAVFMVSLGVASAYLKEVLTPAENRFTFGNVKIILEEPEWDELTPDDKIVYPGKTVAKDPTVKNTGANSAYIFVEVLIPQAEISVVDEFEVIGAKTLQPLFTYDIDNINWVLLLPETVSGDGSYVSRIYGYIAGPVAPGASTTALFDEVTFVNMLEGSLAGGTTESIRINAMAIQSDYIDEAGSVTMLQKLTDAYNKYLAEIAN